jgi:hypothetical protein
VLCVCHMWQLCDMPHLQLHKHMTCGAPHCPMVHPQQTFNLGPKYLHACNPHAGISEYVRQGISQGVRGWSYMFEKLNKNDWVNGVKSTPHANMHTSTHVHVTQLHHPYLPWVVAYHFAISHMLGPCCFGSFPRACGHDACIMCCTIVYTCITPHTHKLGPTYT